MYQNILPRFCWSFGIIHKVRYLMCISHSVVFYMSKNIFYAFKLRKELLSSIHIFIYCFIFTEHDRFFSDFIVSYLI